MQRRKPKRYEINFVCPICGKTEVIVKEVREFPIQEVEADNQNLLGVMYGSEHRDRRYDIWACASCHCEIARYHEHDFIFWLTERNMLKLISGEEENEA